MRDAISTGMAHFGYRRWPDLCRRNGEVPITLEGFLGEIGRKGK